MPCEFKLFVQSTWRISELNIFFFPLWFVFFTHRWCYGRTGWANTAIWGATWRACSEEKEDRMVGKDSLLLLAVLENCTLYFWKIYFLYLTKKGKKWGSTVATFFLFFVCLFFPLTGFKKAKNNFINVFFFLLSYLKFIALKMVKLC